MTTTNDITGDKLKSKPTTDKYRSEFERIFGKPEKDKKPPFRNSQKGVK